MKPEHLTALRNAVDVLRGIILTLELEAGEQNTTVITLDVNDLLPEANEAIRQLELTK
jgi:hypothetical protein